MRLRNLKFFLVLAGMAAAPTSAFAQQAQGWWLSLGLGGATVRSSAPAPAADREGLAASLDFGYRFTPQWGLGLELGVAAPAGGCADWECAGSAANFAPNFTRVFGFGEYRLRDSGWRVRAGAGASRFCYSSHWAEDAWSWGDSLNFALRLLNDDYIDNNSVSGSGNYRCDARASAVGGMLAVEYDWPVAKNAPVKMGVRLSAEAANFSAVSAVGLPAFRHRALMLSLHLSIN